MTMPDIAISLSEWAIVETILQRYLPEHEVWVFGSRARHNPKPFSDLDLAVINDVPLSMTQLADLSEAFSESDLPWKVDIVDWANTSDAFRKIIKSEWVRIKSAGA